MSIGTIPFVLDRARSVRVRWRRSNRGGRAQAGPQRTFAFAQIRPSASPGSRDCFCSRAGRTRAIAKATSEPRRSRQAGAGRMIAFAAPERRTRRGARLRNATIWIVRASPAGRSPSPKSERAHRRLQGGHGGLQNPGAAYAKPVGIDRATAPRWRRARIIQMSPKRMFGRPSPRDESECSKRDQGSQAHATGPPKSAAWAGPAARIKAMPRGPSEPGRQGSSSIRSRVGVRTRSLSWSGSARASNGLAGTTPAPPDGRARCRLQGDDVVTLVKLVPAAREAASSRASSAEIGAASS